MPFKSKSQLRTCYAKKFSDNAKGWNCDEWLSETSKPWQLPERAGNRQYNKTPVKADKGQSCSRGRKLCFGPRGGRYIIRGGVKVYIQSGGKKSGSRRSVSRRPYTERTVAELKQMARDRGLRGYSKLPKTELIKLLRK